MTLVIISALLWGGNIVHMIAWRNIFRAGIAEFETNNPGKTALPKGYSFRSWVFGALVIVSVVVGIIDMVK